LLSVVVEGCVIGDEMIFCGGGEGGISISGIASSFKRSSIFNSSLTNGH